MLKTYQLLKTRLRITATLFIINLAEMPCFAQTRNNVLK